MGKLFGLEKKNKKYINNNVSNQDFNSQGMIAPANNFINEQTPNSEPETFVYQSAIASQVVNANNNMNNYNSNVNQTFNQNSNVNQNMAPYGVNVAVNNAQAPEVLVDVLDDGLPSQEQLNPLNNASNPIPVNPVAEVQKITYSEEMTKDVKANIFSVLGMMVGMLFAPGTTIISSAKKYRSLNKAIFITIWITIVSLLLSLIARALLGSFYRTYNGVTGAYTINFDISNVFTLNNYLEYLVIAFLVSFVAIFVVSLVYYASSFVNSKGVAFGSYLMVSNLALLPFIIGVIVVYPAANIISGNLSILALIFTFLYTLVSFLIGIGEILTFKNINRKILYNVLNLSFIILVMFLIVVLLIRVNILIMPEISV